MLKQPDLDHRERNVPTRYGLCRQVTAIALPSHLHTIPTAGCVQVITFQRRRSCANCWLPPPCHCPWSSIAFKRLSPRVPSSPSLADDLLPTPMVFDFFASIFQECLDHQVLPLLRRHAHGFPLTAFNSFLQDRLSLSLADDMCH